jgi:hypothetical protein
MAYNPSDAKIERSPALLELMLMAAGVYSRLQAHPASCGQEFYRLADMLVEAEIVK